MHKIYTFLLAALLFNLSLAKANIAIDSIGVENNKGKKLILHRVDAKETYYSIAKKYSVNYKEVMTFNENKFLQVGVIIKVPTQISFTTNPGLVATTQSSGLTEYTIKPKDNLNLLAQKFGTTIDEIKRINNLSSINLQIGQVLSIPNGSKPNKQTNTPTEATVTSSANTTTAVESLNNATAIEAINTIEHTIQAKENLNLLAQKYGTTVEEIKRKNGLSSTNLRIGQVLKIPNANNIVAENPTPTATLPVITKPVVQPVATPQSDENTTAVGYTHHVIAGETIYSIAKKYGLTTYQIKTANNLTKNEVTVGQKLIIKDARLGVATDDAGSDEPTDDENTIKDPSLRYPASKYGITQIEEKGSAVWIADQDLDPNKMLVLHRTAPVGTIIKVTNPMSNRSAFAKVVGKFTENESTKDVIIVMTKAVADAVGALDKRFYCNINYGAQDNEQQ